MTMSRRKCYVSGCNRAAYCKQVCRIHYVRMRVTGTFNKTIRDNGEGGLNRGYVRGMLQGEVKYHHVFIAEKALGKKLPIGAEVHHFDEDRSNNNPNNLVICPNRQYHSLLHQRQRALEICGNASWEKCTICKTYDAVQNLKGIKKRGSKYHK